jgi:hypothetical protein
MRPNGAATRLAEVFVPGGLPKLTYNPREELRLEERVRDYLDERYKILSLSGPTKSGKTVLLKTVLPPAIWVSGGSIRTSGDFWEGVTDSLGAYTSEQAEISSTETAQDTTGMSGGAGIPHVAHLEGKAEGTTGTTSGRTRRHSRERSPMRVALTELQKHGDTIIVVDDFHYIPPDVQLEIVRALKESIFSGLRVIFASVPHRAFDVVRVEKEMTGRVEQLPIEFWSHAELEGIAVKGFEALNINASDSPRSRLANESFGSPHLMQDFCLSLCKLRGVRSASSDPIRLDPPDDWRSFFTSRANTASKSAFDLLKQGPRQRTDRKERVLRDGSTTDIYGAVLAAIAATGPRTELHYTDLRASLRDVLASDAPQRHEVTRVLEEMTKIAREKIEGEPVVDYDLELETLYISDPFFAYFLRWGTGTDT